MRQIAFWGGMDWSEAKRKVYGMRPTVEYIEQRFREYNSLYFNDMLPEIPVVLSRSKSFLGACTYKRRRITGERYDFKLRISTRMDLPEEEVQDTIIHEMIHFYIFYTCARDTSAHGRIFRSIMATINEKFGRHVTISHRPTAEQREDARDKRPKPHVIALVTLRDGRTGIKVIPATQRSLTAFRRGIRRAPSVKATQYWLTSDPFFTAWPSSSALRIHFPDLAAVRDHLADATPL